MSLFSLLMPNPAVLYPPVKTSRQALCSTSVLLLFKLHTLRCRIVPRGSTPDGRLLCSCSSGGSRKQRAECWAAWPNVPPAPSIALPAAPPSTVSPCRGQDGTPRHGSLLSEGPGGSKQMFHTCRYTHDSAFASCSLLFVAIRLGTHNRGSEHENSSALTTASS